MIIDIYNTDNRYNIIYADPPWKYHDKGSNGACENHYSTMNINDICNMPINDIAANDCVLFMWATYPLLPDALKVINAWGFTYKTLGFQWVKKNKKSDSYFFGLGRWTRGNTEPCLLAVKGKPFKLLKSKSVSQIIASPIRRHSQKPDEARDRIVELLGDLPRIELFARNEFFGWDCWGNEVKNE